MFKLLTNKFYHLHVLLQPHAHYQLPIAMIKKPILSIYYYDFRIVPASCKVIKFEITEGFKTIGVCSYANFRELGQIFKVQTCSLLALATNRYSICM